MEDSLLSGLQMNHLSRIDVDYLCESGIAGWNALGRVLVCHSQARQQSLGPLVFLNDQRVYPFKS